MGINLFCSSSSRLDGSSRSSWNSVKDLIDNLPKKDLIDNLPKVDTNPDPRVYDIVHADRWVVS